MLFTPHYHVERAACSFRMLIRLWEQAGSMLYDAIHTTLPCRTCSLLVQRAGQAMGTSWQHVVRCYPQCIHYHVERAACSFRMLIKLCKQAGSMLYLIRQQYHSCPAYFSCLCYMSIRKWYKRGLTSRLFRKYNKARVHGCLYLNLCPSWRRCQIFWGSM